MICSTQYTQYDLAMELLIEHGFEGIAESIAILMNSAMQLERSRHLNAAPYERTDRRIGNANGYKDKTMHTRVGEVNWPFPSPEERNSTLIVLREVFDQKEP